MAGSNEQTKIISLVAENVKGVKAFSTVFNDGLNIIGGDNKAGKSTILHIVEWLLKGGKAKPSNPKRDGSVLDPTAELVLSNGFIVKLSGKNNTLKITDPSGKTVPQKMLQEFVSEFALNLPKFMSATMTEKVKDILKHYGVEDVLTQLDIKESRLVDERLIIGRQKDDKRSYADSLSYDDAVGDQKKSVQELINKQQAILSKNAENQQHRNMLSQNQSELVRVNERIAELERQLAEQKEKQATLENNVSIGLKTVEALQDEDTSALKKEIEEVEIFNERVSENLKYIQADADAEALRNKYESLTTEIEQIRTDKKKVLDGMNLPLDGLSICDGELIYNNQKWDGMSDSEKIIVCVVLAHKLSPKMDFVLVDKLEQMDGKTLKQFSELCIKLKLQVIGTRVSSGEECSIIIEDGVILHTKLPTVNDSLGLPTHEAKQQEQATEAVIVEDDDLTGDF